MAVLGHVINSMGRDENLDWGTMIVLCPLLAPKLASRHKMQPGLGTPQWPLKRSPQLCFCFEYFHSSASIQLARDAWRSTTFLLHFVQSAS